MIEVPFTGNPQPKVSWRFNDENLPEQTRVTVETIYNMTALTIGRARRSDTGTYSVALENANANDKAIFAIDITVVGRLIDEKVEGDREVTSVTLFMF